MPSSPSISRSADDPRALELVNKTNQFNLNGVRYTEADWKNRLARPGAFLAMVSYRDKFGPLGKIAVLEGRREEETLFIDAWVMSCRAFSRRIEHRCLQTMFEHYAAREILFNFQPTPRNGPLRDFFASIAGGVPSAPFTPETRLYSRRIAPRCINASSWNRLRVQTNGSNRTPLDKLFSHGVSGSARSGNPGGQPSFGGGLGFGRRHHPGNVIEEEFGIQMDFDRTGGPGFLQPHARISQPGNANPRD